MPYCTNCGKQNPDDARFCSQCGTRLLTPESEAPAEPATETTATITFGAPDKLVHLLSAPDRHLEVLLMDVPAGHSERGRLVSHEGEEFHLVLEGRVHAVHGDRSFVFEEGDAFHWDGSIPHTVENPDARPARVLVARVPRGFLEVTVHETVPTPRSMDAR